MSPIDDHTDERIRTTCLVILTVIAIGAALVPLRPVLVPLLLALLFTYCLRPVVEVQVRWLRLPWPVAVAGAALVGLALLAFIGLVLTALAADVRANLPLYQRRFAELLRQASEVVSLQALGVRSDPDGAVSISEEASGRLAGALFGSALDLLSGGGLVLIFVAFLLFGGRPGTRSEETLLGQIEARAQRYILQMVGFSTLTGLLVWLALAAVGVPFAFAFGFLAFLLNFIPTVGPLVATLLPLPIVVLDPEMSIAAKVLALALPSAVQGVFAVVQPRVQGRGQELHPVTTMAALVFFGSIWGVLGAALAVPVTGVIKIILERVPTTRPVADWMAGRVDLPAADVPPSTPPGGRVD
jgi:AI-2 transport protein TqsA